MDNTEPGPPMTEPNRPLQIGFVPDGDCAPLVVARESGLFEKYELDVQLQRETRWANIRDKIIEGELDAAHAPATLPFITNLGIESDRCACVAGMVLSLQGNGIVVSHQLWNEGVRDARTLRDTIYAKWGKRTYTFGVVFPYSPPYVLLRHWLKLGNIVPHVEVRIVVLPPAQMFPMLKLGYIDGFCAGEPWTSLAVESQAGVCVATSEELAPQHPEKVLMVRRDFADERAEEHERLIAALLEACAFCDQPENHALVAEMIAKPQYVNAPADCLKLGRDASEWPAQKPAAAPLTIFHKNNANAPTNDKALWVLEQLYAMIEQSALPLPHLDRTPMLKNIFRRDVFDRARAKVFDHAKALSQEVDDYQAAMKKIA